MSDNSAEKWLIKDMLDDGLSNFIVYREGVEWHKAEICQVTQLSPTDGSKEIAEQITREHNTYSDCVKALKDALAWITKSEHAESCQIGCWHGNYTPHINNKCSGCGYLIGTEREKCTCGMYELLECIHSLTEGK